jgi:hypothetical protein
MDTQRPFGIISAMTPDNEPVLLLDHPDPGTRRRALQSRLASQSAALPDPGVLHNMHAHSFFSFNASGWSPTRIVWEARRLEEIGPRKARSWLLDRGRCAHV